MVIPANRGSLHAGWMGEGSKPGDSDDSGGSRLPRAPCIPSTVVRGPQQPRHSPRPVTETRAGPRPPVLFDRYDILDSGRIVQLLGQPAVAEELAYFLQRLADLAAEVVVLSFPAGAFDPMTHESSARRLVQGNLRPTAGLAALTAPRGPIIGTGGARRQRTGKTDTGGVVDHESECFHVEVLVWFHVRGWRAWAHDVIQRCQRSS